MNSEILANASHEIRTPLNAILGFTDCLRRGMARNENERQEYLETIYSNGKHLLELIDHILDLSKMEAGHSSLEWADASPFQIIHDAWKILKVRADEKNIHLQLDFPDPLPITIRTDPIRLRQVLTNLIGNAIKFTDQGGVVVAVRLESNPGGDRLRIDVTDSGIGMNPQQLARAFQPFSQADADISRRFGGTGLGLAISKKIVLAMGGELTVASQPGTGSIFTAIVDAGNNRGTERITFEQFLQADNVSSNRVSNSDLQLGPARILVVDDGPSNRQLIRLVLERAGCRVAEAADGREAIEQVLTMDFDLVMMDMQMPVMNGHQAARKLRQINFDRPIIAVTANLQSDEELKCRQSGCSAFLPKPIDLDRLLQAVARQMNLEIPTECCPEVAADDLWIRETARPEPEVYNQVAPLMSTLPANEPEFAAIVIDFVVALERKLDSMRQAQSRNDHREMAKLAHWLKGAGGTCGFAAFHEPASRLEEFARLEQPSKYSGILDLLESLFEAIVVEPSPAKSMT